VSSYSRLFYLRSSVFALADKDVFRTQRQTRSLRRRNRSSESVFDLVQIFRSFEANG